MQKNKKTKQKKKQKQQRQTNDQGEWIYEYSSRHLWQGKLVVTSVAFRYTKS